MLVVKTNVNNNFQSNVDFAFENYEIQPTGYNENGVCKLNSMKSMAIKGVFIVDCPRQQI